jgi:hypothetical protein
LGDRDGGFRLLPVPFAVEELRLEALERRDEAVDDGVARDDAAARELREFEDRRAFAEAPCFVFLGAITSESCRQASD